MNDDRSHAPRDTRIDRWLRARTESDRLPTPDRRRVLHGALATIGTTHQRRHRWDRLRHGPMDDAVDTDVGSRATTSWRFTTMSATKTIAAIAIISVAGVATIGGLRMVEDGAGTGPPTISPAVEAGPATFSGRIDFRDLDIDEGIEAVDLPDGSSASGRRQAGANVESDDARFGGLASSDFYNVFQGAANETGMFWGDMRIEDDSGAWGGSLIGAGAPRTAFDVFATLLGEGEYDGLYAIVFFDASPTGLFEMQGTILVGEPPPGAVDTSMD